MVEPRILQGLYELCRIRSKINIRSFDIFRRLGISRREESYMSCKAVLQLNCCSMVDRDV